MNSVCIEIKVGDRVVEKDGRKREGVVREFRLTPNGRDDLSLVALVCIAFDEGGSLIATSDKFVPIESKEYRPFYTCDMFPQEEEKRQKVAVLAGETA